MHQSISRIAKGIALAAALFLSGGSALRAQLLEDERNTIDVVKRTKTSVVFITNIGLSAIGSSTKRKSPAAAGRVSSGTTRAIS